MKKKKILALLLIMLFICGCKNELITNKNVEINMDKILTKKIKYVNKDAIGFQYYLPNGVITKEVKDFNQTLYSNGNTYYLYADIVSYYHKVDKKYKVDNNAYLSKRLNYRNKKGYIEINEEDGKYFIEMMFNYAKIEASVSKYDLNDTIINMSYILSSVKYNDDIIETLLGSEKYDLSENEEYNIFNSKKSSKEDNFLDYVNEYDKYDGEVKSLMDKDDVKTNKDE